MFHREEFSLDKETFIHTAITYALLAGDSFPIHAAPAPNNPDKEKCFGVAKAGANDCTGGTHS
jgi:uncharacterized membrane protein